MLNLSQKRDVDKISNKTKNTSLTKLYFKHMRLLASIDKLHFWAYLVFGISAYFFYPFAINFSAKFINSVVAFYSGETFTHFLFWNIPEPLYYAFLWFGIWIIWRIVSFLRDLSEALLWVAVYHGGVYKKIFAKYYSLNLEEIQQNEIFDALSRFGQYWLSQARNIHKNTVALIGATVSLILTFSVMLSEHSSYGLIKYALYTALLPFVSSIALYFQDKFYRRFVKKETNKFRLRDYLITALLDSKTFLEKKVNGIYKYLLARYTEMENQIVVDKNKNWSKHDIVVGIFNTFEYYLFVLLRLFFVATSIANKVKVGTITGNLTFLNNIYNKVKSLLNNTTSIIASVRYTRDLFQILDLQGFADVSDDIPPDLHVKENVKIELKGLSFKFPDTNYIFKDVNFSAKSGDSVLIYGKDGSGKSSFVKVLTASFKLPENTYFINGTPVEKLARGVVKHYFALADEYFDRYFLPLKTNVSELGEKVNNTFSKTRYIEALKIANLYEWAKQHKILYSNKPLGKYFDNGIELPSGLWQRVAIARAIYLDRPIFLCDMCFSYIDQEAKKVILSNLLSYLKKQNKIFVLITEDLDFAHNFDKVFLKQGPELRKLTKSNLNKLVRLAENL